MNDCDICGAPTDRHGMCEACDRSYDRHAHDEGSVYEAMRWAANRAARLRGVSRWRGSLVSISFTADEIDMLFDRVSAGAEVSEECGWEELLDKVEHARSKIAAAPSRRGVLARHATLEKWKP